MAKKKTTTTRRTSKAERSIRALEKQAPPGVVELLKAYDQLGGAQEAMDAYLRVRDAVPVQFTTSASTTTLSS